MTSLLPTAMRALAVISIATSVLAQGNRTYDDFEDGSLDPSLWSVVGPGIVVENQGFAEIYGDGQLTSVSEFDPDQGPVVIRGSFVYAALQGGPPLFQVAWRSEAGDSNGSIPGGLADVRLVFDYPNSSSSNDRWSIKLRLLQGDQLLDSARLKVLRGERVWFEIRDDGGTIDVSVENRDRSEFFDGGWRTLRGLLGQRTGVGSHVKIGCQSNPNLTVTYLDWLHIDQATFDRDRLLAEGERFGDELLCFDMDGDGDLDWVFNSITRRGVSWLENRSEGIPGEIRDLDSEGLFELEVLAHGDLDSDGDQDLLVVDSLGFEEILWFENLGLGQFARAEQLAFSQTRGCQSLAVVDVDGDGDDDFCTASIHSDEVAWFENLGAGSFAAPQVISQSFDGPRGLIASDTDGDQDPDLVFYDSQGRLVWIENLGSGSFSHAPILVDQLNSIADLRVSDLDQDGDPDLIFAARVETADFWVSIGWSENRGPGVFAAAEALSAPIFSSRTMILVEDFDLDGWHDVAGYSNGKGLNSEPELYPQQIFICRSVGGASLDAVQFLAFDAGNTESIAAGDMDQDGDVDLAFVADRFLELKWLSNRAEPPDADQDDDGVLDFDEVTVFGTSYLRFDTDGDGLSDGLELGVSQALPESNPVQFKPDLDPLTTTDPLSRDTDQGGVDDGLEDRNGDGAVDSWETDPNDPQDESLAFYVSGVAPSQRPSFEVFQAAPGALLIPLLSMTGAGPTALGIGVTVDLSVPLRSLTPSTADALGYSIWTGPRVPGQLLPGTPLWLQLIEVPFGSGSERVSNPLLLPVGAH